MRLSSLFFLTMGFFFLLFGFCDLGAAPKSPEVQKIDAQIKELEEVKMGYNAKAIRHEEQAERMQFENRQVLETRRHIELAQENRDKAAEVQREIDQLKTKRLRLTRIEVPPPPDGFEDI